MHKKSLHFILGKSVLIISYDRSILTTQFNS